MNVKEKKSPLPLGEGQGEGNTLSTRERGVAMLIAVVAIAVLTAVATEFAYNSRVELQLATNQRDEIRAYYLARSGIGLSRLLLRFQKQLDTVQLPDISNLINQFLGGGTGGGSNPIAGANPGTGASSSNPALGSGGGLNIQLWKMARIDCQMLQQMVKQ